MFSIQKFIAFICKDALKILDEGIKIERERVKLLHQLRKNEGYGVIEAPRGLLLHHYQISHNLHLKNATILVPTSINYYLINNFLNQVAKKEFAQDKTKNRQHLLRILNIALRTFDPCISCLAL